MRAASVREYSKKSFKDVSDAYAATSKQEVVEVSFQAIESFEDYLMLSAMRQGSLFLAIQIIREVEELNGGRGLSEWRMAKVKRHFSKSAEDENRKNKSQRENGNQNRLLKNKV